MPNHVTNIITITAPQGKTVQEVLDYVKTDDQSFDFNALIPMPEEIKKTLGAPGFSPPWYDWSIENWGTKWNAYHITIEGTSIKFDTAWSAPIPIFESLAEKFPDFTLDIKFADENHGYNFGHVRFDSIGVLFYKLPEEGTSDANKWIFENVLERPDYYDENGNYIGEEED